MNLERIAREVGRVFGWPERRLKKLGREMFLRRFNVLTQLFVEDPVLRLEEFDGDFCLSARSDLFRRIAANQAYEPRIASICRLLAQSSGDAIDVGANVGFFSVLLAQVNVDRRVLAVEPSTAASSRLTSNLRRNNLTERVIVDNSALGAEASRSALTVVSGREEYSTLGSLVHPAVTNAESTTEEVSVKTLDSLVDGYSLRPDFIKIDVEGAELDVLKGAAATLRSHRPTVLCELNDQLLQTREASSNALLEFLRLEKYLVLDVETLQEPRSFAFGEVLALPVESAAELRARLRRR